jgi:hypothetical protein
MIKSLFRAFTSRTKGTNHVSDGLIFPICVEVRQKSDSVSFKDKIKIFAVPWLFAKKMGKTKKNFQFGRSVNGYKLHTFKTIEDKKR